VLVLSGDGRPLEIAFSSTLAKLEARATSLNSKIKSNANGLSSSDMLAFSMLSRQQGTVDRQIEQSLKAMGKGAVDLDKQLDRLSVRETARAKRQQGDELKEVQKFTRDRTRLADQGGRDAASVYEKHLGSSFFSKLGQGATRAFKSAFSVGGLTGGGASGILGAAFGVAGGNLITSILGGVTSKITGAIQTGFDFNKIKEQSILAFEIKLKGKEEAKRFFGDVAKWAVDAPLELDQALESVQRLMSAFNPKEALFALNAITGAVANQGKVGSEAKEQIDGVGLALQQIIFKNKVSAEEMTQLAERQINGWKYVAAEIAKTDQAFAAMTDEEKIGRVQEMAQRGMLNARAVVGVVLRGMEDEFKGTASRISRETLAGIETNTSDRLAQLAGKSTEAAFAEYKKGRQEFLDLINSPVGDIAAEKTNSAVSGITGAMDSLIGKIKSGDFARLGFDAITSVGEGAKSASKSLYDAGAGVAKDLEQGWRDRLDQHSPSQVLIALGFDAGQSLVFGFAKGVGKGDGGALKRWTDEQLGIARRIVEIGKQIGANEKQIRAALSTGIVESRLRNLIKPVDHDSRGIMQQRPSQGWGTVAQITNVDYAIRKFFEVAMSVSQEGTPGQLAARVQRPRRDLRGRYDEYLPQADALYNMITGASGGSLQGNVQKLITNIGEMSDEAARLASDTGSKLREETAQRDKTSAAFDEAIKKANERLTWALRLPERNPGESANKDALLRGAATDLSVLERDRAKMLGAFNSEINELQDTLRNAVLGNPMPVTVTNLGVVAAHGSEFNPFAGMEQLQKIPQYDEHNRITGYDTLAPGELPIIKLNAGALLATLPPLTREVDRLTANATGAMDAINGAGQATADAFGNLPPLINTAAKEAKDSEKEFERTAKEISDIFGTSLATAITGNFRGALQGLKSGLMSFATSWLRDLFSKSIFDAIKGGGASSSGGGGSSGGGIFSSIWKGITGFFGGNHSSSVAGTPVFNPNAGSGINLLTGSGNLRGLGAYGETGLLTGAGGTSALLSGLRELKDKITPPAIIASASSTAGGATSGAASSAAQALSLGALTKGFGFGLKPGSGGGLSAIAPLIALQLGAQLGGQSRLGQILGGAGGLLAGIGLTAAPGFLGTGTLAALFSNPFTAIAGGALLVGAIIAGKNAARRRDEKTRDALSNDTGTAIWQLIAQAQAGSLTLAQAKTEWAQIDTRYHAGLAQIKDKKTRRHAELQWTNDFMPLQRLLYTNASQGDAARAQSALFHETYSVQAFAGGGTVARGGWDGAAASLYGGERLIKVRPSEEIEYPNGVKWVVPGTDRGVDSVLTTAPPRTRVRTPEQRRRAVARAIASAQGFSGGGTVDGESGGWGAPAGAPQSGTRAGVVPMQASVFIDENWAVKVVVRHPLFGESVAMTSVQAWRKFAATNPTDLLGSIEDAKRKQGS
jgi:hypothetical protein